jgi:hypothetical protein
MIELPPRTYDDYEYIEDQNDKPDSDDEYGVRTNSLKKKAAAKDATAESDAEEPSEANVVGVSKNGLHNLLNPDRLKEEADTLGFGDRTLCAPLKASELITQLLDQVSSDNSVSLYQQFMPKDEDGEIIQNSASSSMLLAQLSRSMSFMGKLLLEGEKYEIMSRSIQWQICRSLQIAFVWLLQSGPRTASAVMDTHRLGGLNAVKIAFPQLANVTDQIVRYVKACRSHQKPEKKGKGGRPVNEFCNSNKKPEELQQMPMHFVNLTQDPSSKAKAKLPRISKTIQPGDDAVYKVAKTVLEATWSEYLLIPQMRDVVKKFSKNTGKRTETSEDILDRCLVRGAIVNCFVEVFDGDGILASGDFRKFMTSPARLFNKGLKEYKRLAAAIKKDYTFTMGPLRDYLEQQLKDHPSIAKDAKRIGSSVHKGLLSLTNGKPMDKIAPTRPRAAATTSNPKASGSRRHKQPHIAVTDPQQVLATNKSPNLGALAMMIRECLADRRGQVADTMLNRILHGCNPTNNATIGDSYSFDPVRFDSTYARLIKKHLTPRLMASPMGLSNLLVWTGTGQGPNNSPFINQSNMFSKNVQECIQVFETVRQSNERFHDKDDQLADKQDDPTTKGKKKVSRQAQKDAGYIHIDDSQVWSNAPAMALAFCMRGRPTASEVAERISIFWDPAVITAWTEIAGDLFGTDPDEWKGELPTFRSVIERIHNLKIKGLATGLTCYQTVVTLHYLGFCRPPTMEDIAEFASDNKEKGCMKGLKEMGFVIQTGEQLIRAVKCVSEHIRRHITPEDAKLIDFGPILIENIGCKQGRWIKRMQVDAGEDLMEYGEEEGRKQNWIRGANMADHTQYPFPIIIDEADLREYLCDPIFD